MQGTHTLCAVPPCAFPGRQSVHFVSPFSAATLPASQAMQLSFFFLLPNILLSGFMFPFHAMPDFAKGLSSALPLTHFLRICRRIILQASDFADVQTELVWLLSIVGVLCLFALLRFQKRLS